MKTQNSSNKLRKKKSRKKKPHLKTNDHPTENHEVELADGNDKQQILDKSNQERVREMPIRYGMIRIPSLSTGIFGW